MTTLSQKQCCIEGCDHFTTPKTARGMCNMHYKRFLIDGDPGEASVRHSRVGLHCLVDGCERPPKIKNTCTLHYGRRATTGEFGMVLSSAVNHGMTGSPSYRSWSAMKARCLNASSTAYYKYGARGVTICQEWYSFTKFYEDMGDRPLGTSLDRIDPSGNYEPSNCRWADIYTQAYNRRRSEKVSRRGVWQQKGVWVASISKRTTEIYIGAFRDPDEAAWMYDQYAIALYEDEARLNFSYI